jgi:Sec-independent protein translocase protein TatA
LQVWGGEYNLPSILKTLGSMLSITKKEREGGKGRKREKETERERERERRGMNMVVHAC